MRELKVHLDIEAPAERVWDVFTRVEHWPTWGPSVVDVDCPVEQIAEGTSGRVRTALGVWVPFEVSDLEAPVFWSWKVAGIPATTHHVEPVDADTSRAAFGVPWPAAGYLAVCRIALQRIRTLASG